MNRLIYKELIAWKNRKDHKPLIILGARQVGKTWIMRHFGKQEYQNVAYINCDDEPRAKELFIPDYDMKRILLSIQVITGERLYPAKLLSSSMRYRKWSADCIRSNISMRRVQDVM